MNQFYTSLKSKFFIGMKVFLLGLILMSIGVRGWSQPLSLTSLGTANTQNYDGLPSSGTTLAQSGSIFAVGWSFLEGAANANATYDAGTGSNNAGNTYDFGAALTNPVTDRALGMLQSGSLSSILGFQFTNNTGSTITSLTIGYTGETWRLAAAADNLAFSYQAGIVALNATGYTAVAGLNYTSPSSGVAAAVDGNATANRTVITPVTITGLSIASGTSFTLRWVDATTGSSEGMGIDDFTITANGTPTITPSPSSLTGLSYSFGGGPSSPAASFTVSASGLTGGSGTITLNTSPSGTDYEVSTTSSTTGFGTSATLSYTGSGTIASNTAWVRLKAGLAAGNYNLETISISGGGGNATETVSGSVTAAGYVSANSGDWNMPATWTPVGVPGPTDNVLIRPADVVFTTSSLDRSGASTTVNGGFELRSGGYAFGNNFSYAATGSSLIFNNLTGSAYGITDAGAFWPAANSPYNVTINSGSVGVDLQTTSSRTVNGILSLFGGFNVGAAGRLVMGGTLQLNSGGYISTNSPTYSTGSLLLYTSGTPYNRGLEWTSFNATTGTPYNVQLSNGMTLNYPAGTISAQTATNNLTIDAGASLYMDYSGVNSNGALTVGNNFNLAGNFSMGNTFGDDLKVGGDMNFSSGYGFFPNQRAVIFTKAGGTQTINAAGAATPDFHYLNITASGGGIVKLGTSTSLNITCPVAGNVITFSNAADVIDINGNTLTLGSGIIANAISGSGSFKGSSTSALSLLGSGSIGTMNFTTGFQTLSSLSISRTASNLGAVLGTDLAIANSLSLSSGILNISSNNLTYSATATTTGGGTSWIEADGAGTVRKTFSTAGSWVFHVGDAANYSPATFNFTSGSFGGYAGVNVRDAIHPSNTVATSYTTRYWNVVSSGISGYTCDLTFNYIAGAADVVGTESAIRTGEFQNPGWIYGNNANTTTHTLSVTGETSLATAYTGGDTFTPIATKATDYFRSAVTSGSWSTPGSWESSPTGGAPWITSTLAPTSVSAGITILATHTISISSTVSLDQLVINGTLDVQTGAVLNINDGTGSDISVASGGVLKVSGTSPSTYASTFVKSVVTASIDVATGGKILIANATVPPLATIQTLASDANNLWQAGAVFEYNCPFGTLGASGIVFFPNSAAGVSPILRITAMSGAIGGASATTINGLLEVNASFTFQGTGAKLFRDGIIGTAVLTISNAITGTVTIGGTTMPVLGGTGTLGLILQKSVTIPLGITVPSTAIVNVTSSPANTYGFTKTSGSFLVNGTIDLSDVSIVNTSGDVTVNGILKTSSATGFYNPGNIASGTVVLGGASTIEYNAAGAQLVTIRSDYNNITITGAGTKTLATSSTVSPITGTVTVNTGAALDVSNNTFGSGSTNLTLVTTGKFLNAGSGVKPDMGGTYTLGTGSTIQFDGTSAILVRLVNYYNLYITGTNVSTSTNTAVISLQNGGTFTVAAGAKFKTRSANGFSGGAATSVGNATTPSIVLSPTSTIDYFEPIAQAITNQQAYGNLEISASSGTKTAPATLSILGNIIKSGAAVFAPNSGTVSLDGTALQSYAAIDSMDFYKLINNNSTGFKVGDNLLTVGTAVTVNGGSFGIQNLLTLSSGSKLTFGAGSISMRSSATSTAAIDKMTSATAANISYTGAGRFRIERYVGYNRKWQLLSVPVTETGHTIRTDWMEGSAAANDNLVPGYGMQVTDERVNALALGFDAKSVSGPSVKSYNPTTDTYTGIATPGATITSDAGYFAYVRGDRTSLNTPSTTVATRLRTAGRIRDGNDVTESNGAATTGKFQVVGNPYASAVDARLISGANVTSSGAHPDIYVWDPTIYGGYGVGKFVLLSYNAGNYTADDATGLYNASAVNNFIQSGQAFMVKSSGGTGSVTFHDADKTTASNDVSFTAGHGQTLRTSMYSIDNGTTANGADGALVIFGDDQNSSLDNSDALKMLNTADNLSFKTGGKLIGIERRHTIISNDTLQLSISAMRAVKYRFVIAADNLDAPGRQGWLIDRAVNSSMPLNLAGETSYDFIINNVASSYAADRFIIVFKQIPAARFISVNASADNNKTISVAWQVANENNVSSYSVEQSGNGHEFTGISNVSLVQNNNLTASYNLADAHSLKDADNYFRVKMTLATGAILYSDIVKVDRISDAVYATVSPNPVTDKTIHLQLSNQAAGNYSLQLINAAGATVYKGNMTVNGFFETKNLSLDKSTAAGEYSLILVDEKGEKNAMRVTVL